MNLADLAPKTVTIQIESPALGEQFPPVQLPIGLPTLFNWNSFQDGLRLPEAPVTGMDNRGNKYRDEADAEFLRKMREYNDLIMYRRVTYALAKGGNEFPGAVLFDEQVEWAKHNLAAFIVYGIHQFLLGHILKAKAEVFDSAADFRRNGDVHSPGADTGESAAQLGEVDERAEDAAPEAGDQTTEGS